MTKFILWDIFAFIGQFTCIAERECEQFDQNMNIIYRNVVIGHESRVEYKKLQNRAIFNPYFHFPVTLWSQKLLVPGRNSLFNFLLSSYTAEIFRLAPASLTQNTCVRRCPNCNFQESNAASLPDLAFSGEPLTEVHF